MAERTIFLQRSGLKTLLSERSPMIGVITSTPSSVAFSQNHSKRSMFLVGQTAIFNEYG